MERITFYNGNGIDFRYNETTDTTEDFLIHCHKIFEVYYFIEGDVEYLVEGKLYRPTPYSIILLTPHVFHGVKINSNKPYRRYTLHFEPNILHLESRSVLLSSFPSLQRHSHKEVYYENTGDFLLDVYFHSIAECTRQKEQLRDSLLQIYVESLLAQLTMLCQKLEPSEMQKSINGNITDIIAYLDTHLTENINLNLLSEKFFISKNYLNRLFKKATGTTIGDYIIYKRIIYGNQLLLSGHSANQASIQCGFHDYSAFYRAYKKVTGHSPKQDRREGYPQNRDSMNEITINIT